ncbi:DUF938 domain-containing protein [Shimia haliotis]|uniref:Methyltransferase domain-containing protein n=1 Tax=Shimia haliotis TaxID=1280847 RepID=A0A1I4DXI1_9RHOB|nr:DUF938 domain-containing protein [Shimia haliotis]SFK96621.1 Protein of unknown function [Shimia haliotis]
MPRRLNLPDSASVATPAPDGKLFAPSAARNVGAIAALLKNLAPVGNALEIASGTGQHVVHFAQTLPQVTWQPTEIDPIRRASIAAYLVEADLPNVLPPVELDATAAGWGVLHKGQNLITLCNLLHLVSEDEARTLVSEAAQALAPDGLLMIYGPFKRGDVLVSDGDKSFDDSLRAQDPEIGYKSDATVVEWGESFGLTSLNLHEMPANNLALLWQKPS